MKHTHPQITSKFLRHCLASELWQSRAFMRSNGHTYPPEVVKRSKDDFSMLRYGIESGVWAVQKAMINDDKRIH